MEEKTIEGQVPDTEGLAEQARIRREKLKKLQSEGKDPYEKVKFPRRLRGRHQGGLCRL